MAKCRHHEGFTALWWNLGPYGDQDVHIHSCATSTACGGPTDCDRVIVGRGRDCDPKAEHKRATLPLPNPFFRGTGGKA